MTLFTAKIRHLRDLSFANATASALQDRLSDVTRSDFPKALWVGGGDGRAILNLKTIGSLDVRSLPVEGAIERFPYEPESLDLIVVNGTLNVVNDLPGVLIQMRRSLKPDGLFLCALPGGETLFELRDVLMRIESGGGIATRIHPTVDLQTFAGLMQRAGFALPVADSDIKTIFYRDLKTLLRDIKNAGEGLMLEGASRKYVGKHFWDDVDKMYRAHHAGGDGLMRASVEIIYGIGWGPSVTQQKPLHPGAGQRSLAEALGSTEISLPDRAKPH